MLVQIVVLGLIGVASVGRSDSAIREIKSAWYVTTCSVNNVKIIYPKKILPCTRGVRSSFLQDAWTLPTHSRIVGGEPTTIENYPFIVGMLEKFETVGFYQSCGGTLITPSTVVSAGHCFVGLAITSSRVRLGSTNRTGGVEHLVSRITSHELFNYDLIINDVAIVKLSTPAVLSNQIKTARLAGPNYNIPKNMVVDNIGWGLTKGGEPSQVLRHVELKVIDQKVCTDRHAQLKTLPGFENWPVVTPEMVCMGILDVGGKGSCQGDSGGPIVHRKDILVAITSWGYECAHPRYPDVKVRVPKYVDWISKNV